MSTRLTWLERMAMGVEQRFPIGHDAWKIIYLIAMVALLPSVLILSLGTGVVAFAHLTRGLYSTAVTCPVLIIGEVVRLIGRLRTR